MADNIVPLGFIPENRNNGYDQLCTIFEKLIYPQFVEYGFDSEHFKLIGTDVIGNVTHAKMRYRNGNYSIFFTISNRSDCYFNVKIYGSLMQIARFGILKCSPEYSISERYFN